MSPDEMRKLAERATMFGSVKERRLAKVVLDLLAENERLREACEAAIPYLRSDLLIRDNSIALTEKILADIAIIESAMTQPKETPQ